MRTIEEQIKDLKEIAVKLRRFTHDCRVDMHEPDEQNLSAKVVGRYFDNAYGEWEQGNEKIVVLKKGKKTFKINLATLIALARLA